MIHCSQPLVRRFEFPWVPKIAGWTVRYRNLRRCGVLFMVLLQLKDPLKFFVKRREFLPNSRRDMTKALESDEKPQTFHKPLTSLQVKRYQRVFNPVLRALHSPRPSSFRQISLIRDRWRHVYSNNSIFCFVGQTWTTAGTMYRKGNYFINKPLSICQTCWNKIEIDMLFK